jgi:hypothetical protein
MLRRPSQNEGPQSGMTKPAHDQQVGADGGRLAKKCIANAHASSQGLIYRHAMAREVTSEFMGVHTRTQLLIVTYGEDVDPLRLRQQRHCVSYSTSGRPAVVPSDQNPIDGKGRSSILRDKHYRKARAEQHRLNERPLDLQFLAAVWKNRDIPKTRILHERIDCFTTQACLHNANEF